MSRRTAPVSTRQHAPSSHKVCRFACVTLIVFASVTLVTPAAAQNYSFDARRIALGGVGDTQNLASNLVEEQRRYRKVVLPFGLVQVLRDRTVFDPSHDGFDPVRAMEYAASPLHYTFGRTHSRTGQAFVHDIVNAGLQRDLNAYRGFRPSTHLVAEGLASPSWGKTIAVHRHEQTFHAVYVGAGPYLSVQTEARVDPRLADLLGGAADGLAPDTTFGVSNTTRNQLAMAFTGGYRGRWSLPGRPASGTARDGVYVAANYHHLRGLRLDEFGLDLRLDTDGMGLVTSAPATTPVTIGRLSSSRGRGMAVDLGVAFVVDRWDFGVGASGVANRIEWTALEQEQFVLQSYFDGGDFVRTGRTPSGAAARVELPVNYAGDVAYHADAWSAVAEVAHGFQGRTFRSGLEYRLGQIELRGGGRYSRDQWHPSTGVGFDLTPRFGVDVAVFGTSANIERRRRAALAVSLRFNQQ